MNTYAPPSFEGDYVGKTLSKLRLRLVKLNLIATYLFIFC